MERLSDRVTSIFRIDIKDGRPAACPPGDSTVIYSDMFGLGWRVGLAYNSSEWFAKVRLFLDHNLTQSERDNATVTLCLKANDKEGTPTVKDRVIKISNFGHGLPALLGSWSPSYLAENPYVFLTVTTKTKIPISVTDPLEGTTLAVKQSMDTGDFVDTKFYVFSTKRPGPSAGRPRVIYANISSLRLVLPKSTPGARSMPGLAPPFLVNLDSDHQINEDSMLHAYDYEMDSDLDEDENPLADEDLFQDSKKKGESSSNSSHPPSYSTSTCRMVLVKGVAYKTWAAYVYYRYTGQISFLPLKSQPPASCDRDPEGPPACSPKSMYRLAVTLADERLQEIAFRYIKAGLSKANIIDEAFSWFTAQYPDVSKVEVEEALKYRRIPEVSRALKTQLKVISAGEKPWAFDVLSAIMEGLNVGGASM